MNINEVREVIRQTIVEAQEKGQLPKSGGKLVELKKELAGLKKMKESLNQFALTESSEDSIVAEYAHMQKFVNEINKIKAAHASLAEMLDGQISEVEGRIATETQKIKEMIGLIEPSEAKKKKPSAGMTKKEKSAVSKKAHAGKDIGKKGKDFEKVAKAGEKQYGSKEAGQKVAAAAMWKAQAKK